MTLTVLAATVLALLLPQRLRRPDWLSQLAIWLGLLALVMVVPFTFIAVNFGYADFETVTIMASDVPVSDMVGVAVLDFARPLMETIATTGLLLIATWFLMRWLPGFVPILALIAVFSITTSHPASYAYGRIFPDPAMKMIGLADLEPPEIQAVPKKKPNLVLIYLESLERSYRDIPASSDAFADFGQMEDKGFSARNVGQIHGTHFSAAGHVATLCGVPMLPRGLSDPKKVKTAEDATRHGVADFLPGVTCLGDILSEQDYDTTYINGADAELFAIAELMRSHGFASVRGLKTEPEHANSPSNNTWGVPDSELFKVGTEELDRLSAGSRPFALVLFTSSTHGPYGYLDPGCDYVPPIKPAQADSLMPATIHCSGALVKGFLEELDRLNLTDDTVVALMSDHLVMANTMIKELKKVGDARRNYVVILNDAGGIDGTVSDRAATMMDVYPTILEAMGFTLKNGAGNLGRSLLSGGDTLAETLGLDTVNRALFGNQEIRRSVWTPR